MPDDPALLSAGRLLRHFRRGELSPVEATEAALARIRALDPLVNAFVLVDAEGALATARGAEARWGRGTPQGLLDGVPTTVKDISAALGWPLRLGTRVSDPEARATFDHAVVARLREQGAVFLGKTTTSEFGWKGTGDSPLTGSTRNPWDRARTSGGSSAGAAVAAALGMGALHHGSDGAGSIRIPAAFCGVFGFKPSFGVVPNYPPSRGGTLAHHGPITRSVADAALMLTVIAEPDARDGAALPVLPQRDFRIGLEDGVRGLRIAYSADLGGHPVDPEIARLAAGAVSAFEELGAVVEEATPELGDVKAMLETIWDVGFALFVEDVPAERRALLDPGLLALAERGRAVSGLALRAAENARAELAARMSRFHARHDLLVTPQMPIEAPPCGHDVPPGSDLAHWHEWSPFAYPFNLSQQPAASVPCGLTPGGLPAGLQIVGAKFADALVLRAARAFETARPFALPPLAHDHGRGRTP